MAEITTRQALARMIVAVGNRHCPLTGGCRTVFSSNEAFVRACTAKQKAALVLVVDGSRKQREEPTGRCGQCLGRNRPPEITIQPSMEVAKMGSGEDRKLRALR
jgi:hypothetical protein